MELKRTGRAMQIQGENIITMVAAAGETNANANDPGRGNLQKAPKRAADAIIISFLKK